MVSFAAVLLVLAVGTVGYWIIGGGNWSLAECGYLTVVVVTTLGLETLDGYKDQPYARGFTAVLLLTGIGTFLYFASTLTAFILESDLREVFRRKRMKRSIDALEDHVIVCGVGQTGQHVVRELIVTRTPFVAVDRDESHVETLLSEHPNAKLPYVVGDATDDDVLAEAGVERARAIVAALHDDQHNLYIVVTARQVNPRIRIVAKSIGIRAHDKLLKAGADSVVSTTQIGGSRLASEVLRPHVTEFLEEMLRKRDMDLRMEEVYVPPDSPLAGKRLRDAHIRAETNALVLAIRNSETGEYTYNPGPDVRLEGGSTLIVMLPIRQLKGLREGVASGFRYGDG